MVEIRGEKISFSGSVIAECCAEENHEREGGRLHNVIIRREILLEIGSLFNSLAREASFKVKRYVAG